MQLTFQGLCKGTEKKHSTKSNQDYYITKFVELPSMNTFEAFGDLGLPVSLVPTQFVLEAEVVQIRNVSVVSGEKSRQK